MSSNSASLDDVLKSMSPDDAKWKISLDEHDRRMREDPAYRAEIEAEDACREAKQKQEMELIWAEADRRDAEKRRIDSGMPRRLWDLMTREGGPEKTEPVKAALRFMKGPKTLLFLAGTVGTGKTVAACAAMEIAFGKYVIVNGFGERLPNPKAARFVKAIEFVRAGSFDREFIDKLHAAMLLVIDDLGTEQLDDKGWTLANVRAVLDERYDLDRKTIITTNLSLEGFKKRYGSDGGRLVDRLREAGTFEEFAGASMRKGTP